MYQLKVCSKCRESKAHSEFNKNKSKKDGLDGQCKVCNKNWREANKERRKELNKNWYEVNKERKKEASKNWRDNNKERRKNWYEATKEHRKETSKNWRDNNKERRKEYNKNWREANKEFNNTRPKSYYKDREGRFKYCPTCDQDKPLIRFTLSKSTFDGFRVRCMDCINKYEKQRRKTDIQAKLRCDLRNTSRRLINLAGKIKQQSTEEIMNAEFTEAENILLDQMFKDGYTIEQLLNGELELDHKQPLAWFDLTNEDEYREAGHISNLHYILKEENRKKGDRYAHGPNNEIILHEEWLKKRQVTTISH